MASLAMIKRGCVPTKSHVHIGIGSLRTLSHLTTPKSAHGKHVPWFPFRHPNTHPLPKKWVGVICAPGESVRPGV